MPQVIDISNPSCNIDDTYKNGNNYSSVAPAKLKFYSNVNSISFEDNEKLVKETYPNKLLFTIQEVATILNTSYEFIRKNLIYGKIPHISFGDRKMINLTTVINLITFGVSNGNYQEIKKREI